MQGLQGSAGSTYPSRYVESVEARVEKVLSLVDESLGVQ